MLNSMTMNKRSVFFLSVSCAVALLCSSSFGGEATNVAVNPYLGAPVTLAEAPNGAIVGAEVLSIASKIVYLEPTTEKVTDGKARLASQSLKEATVSAPNGAVTVQDALNAKMCLLQKTLPTPQNTSPSSCAIRPRSVL